MSQSPGGLALRTRYRLAGELGRFLITVLRQRRAELVLDGSGSIEALHLDSGQIRHHRMALGSEDLDAQGFGLRTCDQHDCKDDRTKRPQVLLAASRTAIA